jgi:nitrogen regulatory protein PII
MKAVKRLEIVMSSRQMTEVCRILDRHGVPGYTLIRDVAGKGERGMQFADGLNAAFANSYLLTTCEPDALPALVEALRPLLTRHGGECLVSDAWSVRH